jgi:hypothetical protein
MALRETKKKEEEEKGRAVSFTVPRERAFFF